MFGSKLVSDVQSNGLVDLGVTCRVSGEMIEDVGDVLYIGLSGEKCLDTAAEDSGWNLEDVKVKLVCFNMTFSD